MAGARIDASRVTRRGRKVVRDVLHNIHRSEIRFSLRILAVRDTSRAGEGAEEVHSAECEVQSDEQTTRPCGVATRGAWPWRP